jgi:hypothetical protein
MLKYMNGRFAPGIGYMWSGRKSGFKLVAAGGKTVITDEVLFFRQYNVNFIALIISLWSK